MNPLVSGNRDLLLVTERTNEDSKRKGDTES